MRAYSFDLCVCRSDMIRACNHIFVARCWHRGRWGGGGGKKRQRSEGEGGAMGEDQQQPQRFQPPQQFGARWESPSQGQNA